MAGTYKTDRYNVPQFPAGAFGVPADGADLALTYPDGVVVYTLTAGDVVVTPLAGGADIGIGGVPAFTTLPFRVRAVKPATTAFILGIV